MLFFILLIVACPSLILTDDFHNVKFAPLTLTSVPYLNGEIAVYKHVNQSRYYLPPLAIVQLDDTSVLKNRLTGRSMVRFGLVLFTKGLHDTVLEYLQKNLNQCKNKSECQIKMIPIDRLRVVWKRLHTLANDYELDSSWTSNTILLNAIYFNIYCTSHRACEDLRKDVTRHPEIIDGLELEYNTPTEKHTRQEIEIKGSHVIRTNMFAALKQMPTVEDSNMRYLLVDDMNVLISEALSNVEMESITDAGYVSYDDQNLMRDLLKSRIVINQEVLLGHQARQWGSVYWNSDSLRPDLAVKSLNDVLQRANSENSTNTKRGSSNVASNVLAFQNVSDVETQKMNEMDRFASNHLDSEAFKKYSENRQYLELHGNSFEVKQINAHRINLGQFQETLRLASKSIVVQRINSTHAIPIRALGSPLVLTPALEIYKSSMDEKLTNLKSSLLDSIHETFKKYKNESQNILFRTLINSMNVIGETLSPISSTGPVDHDFRILMKKVLTKFVTLKDIGLFDNAILDYYRYDANPIENITIVSLQPLKVGLQFSNAYIEGMVCDDKFRIETARTICRIYPPLEYGVSSTPLIRLSAQYEQKLPFCRFKTNFINEEIPCPYVLNELECAINKKSLKDCDYKRATRKDATRLDENINITC